MIVTYESVTELFLFSYLDTAKCFEKEVGSNINKYEVCDNIDLITILQVRYREKAYINIGDVGRVT